MYSYFWDESAVYLVLEWAPGGDLFEMLEELPEQRFSEAQARVIIKQVCEAVSYLHSSNILHRDIKLENILVASCIELQIKLSDFGWAAKIKPN